MGSGNAARKIRYRYDRAGNITSVRQEGRQTRHTDRKGLVTETRYNVYGQPVLQVCTDKKGDRHVTGTWEYDDFGQLRKSVAGGFSYTYIYRPDGKLLKKWSSGKLVLS